MKAFGDNFIIKEKHGVIRTNNDGSTLEIRTVSWYGKPAKLDIRNWNGDSLVKSDAKLTLTLDDAKTLNSLLNEVIGNSKEENIPHDKTANYNKINKDLNPILSQKITIWD